MLGLRANAGLLLIANKIRGNMQENLEGRTRLWKLHRVYKITRKIATDMKQHPKSHFSRMSIALAMKDDSETVAYNGMALPHRPDGEKTRGQVVLAPTFCIKDITIFHVVSIPKSL